MISTGLTILDISATAAIAPLARPITTAQSVIPAAPLVLINVTCTDGIVGRSYIFGYTPVSLRPLVELLNNLAEPLLGKPLAPIDLQSEMDASFRLLGRQGLLGMAMAGLDMAFWDALGKSANMSVARLLGGAENPIKCYDSHGVFDPKSSAKDLEKSLEQGFSGVKFKIGGSDLKTDIENVKAIRNIIGDDVLLMVDYNQSLDAPEATHRIEYLSEFNLHWVEEPVPAEDFAGHAAVRAASDVAIQTGENWWFPEDAARAAAAHISDFAMLDIMKIGGITGWLRAAAITDAAALPVSSHIFIEASAHAMAVTPNAHLLEYLDVASAILTEPSQIKDGKLAPKGPGLGMGWDDSAVQKYRV